MRAYEITFGSGLYEPYSAMVKVEDWECEQDAVDKLIDTLEQNDDTGLLLTIDEIEEGGYYDDEYVIGGNHGLALLTCGVFYIEEHYDGQTG